MLARIRDRFIRRYWTVPLCLMVMLFLTFEGGNLLNAEPRAVTRFSDVDLYRGIFFADGPVADLVPEIRDELRVSNFVHDRNTLRAIRSTSNRIINRIAQTNPAFLRSFGEAMRSGNHLRISRALEYAGVVTAQAISGMPEIRQLRLKMKADPGLRDQMLTEIQRAEGADQIPTEEIEKALDLVLADSLDRKDAEGPYVQSASIVALIFAVAAVVAAITVVAAQSYGLLLNIAAAAVFVTALVGDSGTTDLEEASLFREQLIDSVAVMFGPATSPA